MTANLRREMLGAGLSVGTLTIMKIIHLSIKHNVLETTSGKDHVTRVRFVGKWAAMLRSDWRHLRNDWRHRRIDWLHLRGDWCCLRKRAATLRSDWRHLSPPFFKNCPMFSRLP